MSATIERQALADWVREDGHDGCAIVIEEVPEFMLPSVLTWTARHMRQHVIFVDDEAFALPYILLAEAENLRLKDPDRPTVIVPALMIVACVMVAAFAAHQFAS